jgi:hypothetical protein
METRNQPSYGVFWKQTDGQHPRTYTEEHITQEQSLGGAAAKAADNAKSAGSMALPTLTMAGIGMLTAPSSGGYDILRPLGLPLTIGGFVIDVVKAPVCLAVATEEGARAGITKLISLLFEKSGPQQALNNIFKSFLLRMRETATLLVALGLEDETALDQKLKSGDIEELVGLTLLHTAYASRRRHDGLLFANSKILTRKDCPEEGYELFDKVIALKESIKEALKLAGIQSFAATKEKEKEVELEESRVVCQWIKLIKAAAPVTEASMPGVTSAQAAIVNKILAQIQALKQLGMAMLPETPAQVVSHMPKAKKM